MEYSEFKKHYEETLKKTFSDFLQHELILCDPYNLTDEEIWDGIKGRSNNRPHHRCDLINRMNQYCTLITIKGHELKQTNYNSADYGVFNYKFDRDKTLEMLYSVFRFPCNFFDMGFMPGTFSGTGNAVYVTVDMIENNSRTTYNSINPQSLFENASNIGCDIFIEYSIEGKNKFGSTKFLPSFANIDESTPGFVDEVRKSLLKTKYYLLSLVQAYPTHLMHEPRPFEHPNEWGSIFKECYDTEIAKEVEHLKTLSAQELSNHQVVVHLPF